MAFAPRLGPNKSPLADGSAAERDLLPPLHGKKVNADDGPAPSVYIATDPGIIWINNRPLWIHGVLGSGGFATVYRVEMLVPFGCKVGRDADGGLIFNEEGFVAVYRSDHPRSIVDASTVERVSIPVLVPGGGASTGRGELENEPDKKLRKQALELSELPPNSISYFCLVDESSSVGDAGSSSETTPTAARFFRVESLSACEQDWSKIAGNEITFPAPPGSDRAITSQAEAGFGGDADKKDRDSDVIVVAARRAGAAPGADEEEVKVDDDMFSVTSNNRLIGAGVFFALKVQAAKCKKQLEEFVEEVVNFRKLCGSANVVQIRDHTLMRSTLHLMILMELGACDLRDLLRRFKYSLSVAHVSRIWGALLRGVEAAHQKDIIHRDLKPQNFLLVPVESPFADRILATTSTPPEKFEFRILDEKDECGDVALTLRDSWTGHDVVLRCVIKLSDFGLAQPLELEESHLSVQGHAGTLKYMAPETVQPTTDCRRQLSKRVDIWSLGMMLFQMLHNGRTPFDRFFQKGDVELAVAIASKVVHEKVVKFERAAVFAAERQKVEQSHSENGNAATSSRAPLMPSKSVGMVSVWLQTEILFRMCERCLAFEVADRAEAADLIRWGDDFAGAENWEEKISIYLRNGSPCVDVETSVSVPQEMEKEFFPEELWRCAGNEVIRVPSSFVQNEAPIAGPSAAAAAIGGAAPDVVDKGEVTTSNPAGDHEGSIVRLPLSAGREEESLHVRRSGAVVRTSEDNAAVDKSQDRLSISASAVEHEGAAVYELSAKQGEVSPLILHRNSSGCISGQAQPQVLSKDFSSREDTSGKTSASCSSNTSDDLPNHRRCSSYKMYYVIVGIVTVILLAAGFTLVGLISRHTPLPSSVSPGTSPTDFLAPVVSHDSPKSKPPRESSPAPAPVPVEPTPAIPIRPSGTVQPAPAPHGSNSTSAPLSATPQPALNTPPSPAVAQPKLPKIQPRSGEPSPAPASAIHPSGTETLQPASAPHVPTSAVPSVTPQQVLGSAQVVEKVQGGAAAISDRLHLTDEDAFDRLEAIRDLAQLVEKAEGSLVAGDFIKAISVHLTDENLGVRGEAGTVLAQLVEKVKDNTAAGEAISEAISERLTVHEDPSLRQIAIEALAQLVEKVSCLTAAGEVIKVISNFLRDENEFVRKKAIKRLAQCVEKVKDEDATAGEAIKAILDRLTVDKDVFVRREAIGALAQLAENFTAAGQVIFTAISDRLRDEHELVREKAIEGLTQFAEKAAGSVLGGRAITAISDRLKDKNENLHVRSVAVRTLAHLVNKGIVPAEAKMEVDEAIRKAKKEVDEAKEEVDDLRRFPLWLEPFLL